MADATKMICVLETCRKQSFNMGLKGAFFDTDTIDQIIALLKEQEEKTGHWIYESQFADCWSNTCSECGKRFTNAIDSFAPYCWNCGAKMEGR